MFVGALLRLCWAPHWLADASQVRPFCTAFDQAMAHVREPDGFDGEPLLPRLTVRTVSEPVQRWRKKAQEVIKARRAFFGNPGIDVRRESSDILHHIKGCVSVNVVEYSATNIAVRHANDVHSMKALLDSPVPDWAKVRWVDVKGLSGDMIWLLAQRFDWHPLSVEDIVNIPQRPKADVYESHLYVSIVIVKETPNTEELLVIDKQRVFTKRQLATEQASLFLMRDGTVISIFQFDGEFITAPILQRLQDPRAMLKDSGDSSFLLYSILDAAVDSAMPLMACYENALSKIEDKILQQDRPKASLTKQLHLLQTELQALRKSISPTRVILNKLRANANDPQYNFISQLTSVYLADAIDHADTTIEDIDSLCITSSDLINLVFNNIAHSSNRSMQALSVVSTIFLPITFIAGVYGTNFDILPELHWQYGYEFFWGLCTLLTVVFVWALGRLGVLNEATE